MKPSSIHDIARGSHWLTLLLTLLFTLLLPQTLWATPTVTKENISITGGTGTDGAYIIGNTVTASWDNTAGEGDNISDVTAVTVDFSGFGGVLPVTATNTDDIWTATYTITAGTTEATNVNVAVTVTTSSALDPVTDDTNATVDNKAPTIISLSPTNGGSTANISDNLVAVFSENMQGTGSISITDTTDNVSFASYSVTDSQIGLSNATLTIDPTANLTLGHAYNVQFASGVLKDVKGNAFAGITSATGDDAWAFTAKGSQTVSFDGGTPTTKTLGDPAFAVTATSSASLTVTLTSTTTSVCTVAEGTTNVTTLTVGTCTLQAEQAGNGSYNAATPVTTNIQVVKAEPSSHPTGFTATANTASQITTTWTDATAGAGETAPDGYLVMCNTSDSFTDPVDGTAQANDTNCAGGGIQNVAHGASHNAVWTGLTGDSQYFFKVFPYTNAGTDINYKLNGTVPTANATTDGTAPTVTSIIRQTPSSSPTNADSLVWRVTFSENVTNVDAADFSASGTTATVSVSTITTDTVYDVTVSGGDLADLNATAVLSFATDQNITDTASNALTVTNPPVTNNNTYVVDNTAPTITSIIRQTPSSTPTNADTLVWRITFNEGTVGVSVGDFIINGSTATVTSVGGAGGNAYDVTASGGDLGMLNASITLNFDSGMIIRDSAGNALTATTPTGTNDRTYVVDNTMPTLAAVTSVTTPTYDSTPDYTFSTSEAGTITYGGSCASSTTTTTSGNKTITFNTLDVGTYDDCTITVTDAAGNASSALTVASFTVLAVKAEPTNHPTDFTATPNAGTQITTTWTAATGDVVPDGYLVMCNTSGTFSAPADSTAQTDDTNCADGAGVKNIAQGTASYAWTDLSAGDTRYFKVFPYTNAGTYINYKLDGAVPTANATTDGTAPTVTSIIRQTPSSSSTNADSLVWRVTFSEAVQNVTQDDFSVSGAGSVSITVSGNTLAYDVTVSGGNLANMNATATLSFASEQNIKDIANNAFDGSLPNGAENTYALDNTVPTLEAVTPVTTPTYDSTPDYTFSTSEAGTITYGGSCSSSTTSATSGSNTITFNTLGANTYSNCTITVTDAAGNASSALTVASFTVLAVKAEPTNHPTGLTSTANSTSQITTTWTDATGAVVPDGYLVMCSRVSADTITAPTDGQARGDDSDCAHGTAVMNIAQGTRTVTWNNLETGKLHYFKVFPYTNAGTYIDYKTTGGTPASTSVATRSTVTAAKISIAGASGANGAYIVGDTVTATWDNTASGNNNPNVTGVTFDFSGFGGGSAVAASEDNGTWTATYTIVAGNIEGGNINVAVSASTAGGTTTTTDDTNATVDNKAPTISSLSPADNATGVAVDTNLVMTFSENMQKVADSVVTVNNSSNNSNQIIGVNDNVTVSNTTVTIDPPTNLAVGSNYNVQFGGNAFKDSKGNAFAGIMDATTWSFSTAPGDQTITFAADTPTTKVFGNAAFTVTATSSASLSVTLASTTPSVCTVSSSTVTIVTAGICTLKASQAGDTQYTPAADVTHTIAVALADQTITFSPPAAQVFLANGAFSAPASSSSGLTVTLTSDGSICSVSGNTVTMVAPGNCVLTASQAGNGNYNGATPVVHTVALNNSNGVPVVSATSPKTVAAKAGVSAYSLTDLGIAVADDEADLIPVAYYKEGDCNTTVPADYATSCRAVPAAGFASGKHELWWVVEDSGHNRNQVRQTLNVLPQVGFANNLILTGVPGTGNVQTRLVLGGPSPSASAFNVPFTVAGTGSNPTDHNLVAGNFTFQPNVTASDPVTVTLGNAPIDGNTVIINLTTSNAVFGQAVTAGDKTSQTITISQNRVYPPRLSNLIGIQAAPSQVQGVLFDKTKGNVQMSFGTNDEDGGSYTYSWLNSDASLVLESGLGLTTATIPSPVLNISALAAGHYYAEVQVTDNTAVGSQPVTLGVMIGIVNSTPTGDADSDGDGETDASEGLTDTDGDGIPDYLDAYDEQANIVPSSDDDSQGYLVSARPGLRIRIGATATTSDARSVGISLEDIAQHGDNGQPTGNATPTNATLAYILDYEIENMDVPADPLAPGNTADLTIPLSTPLTAEADFLKYNVTEGWHLFTVDSNNVIAWAAWQDGVAGNCPAVSSAAYTTDLAQKAGKNCLRVTLQDGGPNDDDNTVNGRIKDPLGIGLVGADTPISGGSGGGGGGGSVGLVELLSVLLLLGLWQRRRYWSNYKRLHPLKMEEQA